MRYLSGVTTLRLDSNKCRGCGKCTEVCPHGILQIPEHGSPRKVLITDIDLCMECGACSKNCEFEALSVQAGVGCAAALINAKKNGGVATCDCSGGSNNGTCCG